MKYTPSQFRDAVGLPQETYRHWRKVLPIFANHNGNKSPFTIGDLIVGVVIKSLRTQIGVSISKVADMSLEFEKTCSHTPWALLQKSLLVMDMENRTCRLYHENELLAEPSLQIIMPLSPILKQITDALMRDANQQQQIHFPPNIIPSLPNKKSSQS